MTYQCADCQKKFGNNRTAFQAHKKGKKCQRLADIALKPLQLPQIIPQKSDEDLPKIMIKYTCIRPSEDELMLLHQKMIQQEDQRYLFEQQQLPTRRQNQRIPSYKIKNFKGLTKKIQMVERLFRQNPRKIEAYLAGTRHITNLMDLIPPQYSDIIEIYQDITSKSYTALLQTQTAPLLRQIGMVFEHLRWIHLTNKDSVNANLCLAMRRLAQKSQDFIYSENFETCHQCFQSQQELHLLFIATPLSKVDYAQVMTMSDKTRFQQVARAYYIWQRMQPLIKSGHAHDYWNVINKEWGTTHEHHLSALLNYKPLFPVTWRYTDITALESRIKKQLQTWTQKVLKLMENIRICHCNSYHKELISYLDSLLPLIDKMYMLRDLQPVNSKDFPESHQFWIQPLGYQPSHQMFKQGINLASTHLKQLQGMRRQQIQEEQHKKMMTEAYEDQQAIRARRQAYSLAKKKKEPVMLDEID